MAQRLAQAFDQSNRHSARATRCNLRIGPEVYSTAAAKCVVRISLVRVALLLSGVPRVYRNVRVATTQWIDREP
jgi:hypothetical protein